MPDRLRLHLKDGTIVALNHARIHGDSLRGINDPRPDGRHTLDVRPEPLGRVPRAVALNEIGQVEANRFSGPKSLLLVLTTVGVVFLGAAFAFGGGRPF